MASIKVKFRASVKTDSEGSVYYQIIHERRVRQVCSHYCIFPSEWDETRSQVNIHGTTSERRTFLHSVRDNIRWDVERLTRIIRRLDSRGIYYTADDVADEFRHYLCEYTLFNFMSSIILKLRHNGKIRTSETYSATLKSFMKFNRGDDIMLDCITTDTMESYEAWLQSRGLTPNSISFYTRILRAVYNRAVDREIIENRNPFRHVYTGIDKTVKRALPLKSIRAINNLDLTSSPALAYARDMFILSFMLRGMSFIDMAYLRKNDLAGGYVTYRRRKTGQQLTIRWTIEMQDILDKYPVNPTLYLLPIIRSSNINERNLYRRTAYNINRNLKKIAEMVGIRIPLTLYVARHSWASAAKVKGIPISVISEGMGHDSETTTQIYLASLDTSAIDKANSIILKSL